MQGGRSVPQAAPGGARPCNGKAVPNQGELRYDRRTRAGGRTHIRGACHESAVRLPDKNGKGEKYKMQTNSLGLTSSPAELIFYGAFALAGIVMLIHFMRSGKPVTTALKGMASGGLGLVLLHFFGEQIGLALPLNLFTVFISLTLGLPGTAAMAVIELLTR